MKTNTLPLLDLRAQISRAFHLFLGALALSTCFVFIGCSSGGIGEVPGSDRAPIVQTPANFEAALKQNQSALAERKNDPDVALYNIGLILAHPSNPKKDQPRAIQSFKSLITEHPRSTLVEQAKIWVQVLEQQQKVAEERLRLAEEKRALSREREVLQHERQKLNYANEKSQQLDREIEKRRRQSLSK